jgi:hypothetical protein
VRAILGNIGVLVLADQRAVPNAHQEFTEDGQLRDEPLRKGVQGLGEALVKMLKRLGEA